MIASQLVDLLTDTFLKLNILKRYIKCLADCKDITTRNKRELVKYSEPHRVLMRGFSAKKVGCSTLYVKKRLKCFESRLTLSENDIMVFPKGGNALSKTALTMTRKYI